MQSLMYIHSFNLYLLSTYYDLGYFLGTWGTSVSKTDKIFCHCGKGREGKERKAMDV